MAVQWDELFSERARQMKASEIREAFKLTECPEVISFAGGFPGPEYFPAAQAAELVRELLTDQGEVALQYGPTDGIAELRQLVARRMTEQGMPAEPEEILLTTGSQQALDLVAKVLVDPGDLVLVEKPGYIGGLGAIASYQARMWGIPMDGDGLRVDLLAEELASRAVQGQSQPKLLYTVATFHNPTGSSLSLKRRRQLLELAERYNFLIVEDNPYGELYFGAKPYPTLRSLDQTGRVIYLGSFSKVFLPGLRVGWVTAPTPLLRKLSIAKQSADLCSGTLGQKLIAEFIRRGLLEPHIQRLRPLYRAKRDAMLEALERYAPPGVSWTRPEGGFFVWLTLPPEVDARLMLTEALEERVAYVSGGPFHIDGSGQNTIRLAYSQCRTEQIAEGIRRLCRVIGRWVERTSGPVAGEAQRRREEVKKVREATA